MLFSGVAAGQRHNNSEVGKGATLMGSPDDIAIPMTAPIPVVAELTPQKSKGKQASKQQLQPSQAPSNPAVPAVSPVSPLGDVAQPVQPQAEAPRPQSQAQKYSSDDFPLVLYGIPPEHSVLDSSAVDVWVALRDLESQLLSFFATITRKPKQWKNPLPVDGDRTSTIREFLSMMKHIPSIVSRIDLDTITQIFIDKEGGFEIERELTYSDFVEVCRSTSSFVSLFLFLFLFD